MDDSSHRRLFFALWPDAAVRTRIDAATESLAAAPGARRVRAERLHLTLHFLGDVPDGACNGVRDAGAAVAADRFDLVLDRAGGFARARVAWLGCSHTPAALIDLHAQLGAALRERGFAVESRPFAPHVTVRRDVRRPTADASIEPIDWPVDAFVLIESRKGCGYVEIGRWPLRG
ncbi:RNA 2',3'-cyclic phosphodiesterase [Cognatilysobacter bugurensis]|uniref:RNA 2',3'-cyclic phosphodiesterase n=1 Tax=Cognatilysobacter bugurensis TaxID=543356 RepID=A0A918W420_9GAMM|nr:RNA 2',3'-cyclic phosphodiesterase [Lysobacter bugurensis]GHA70441.1 RNA 2',3'-cyclic phosphodiesterase [Lysobacter bugurensis]